MSTAFDRIAAGLTDAIAYAEGDKGRGRVVAGPNVKAIRAKTKLTQAAFARRLHISAATLRDWEQGRRAPEGAARTLLGIVDADPKAALELLGKVAG